MILNLETPFMLKEFREFALRGNVVDLAIGVIIGAAFNKIVESIVSDLIMPIIGAITGGLDFSNYYIALSAAIAGHPAYPDAKKAGAAFGYGQFLTVTVNFIIVAIILFLIVRAINTMKRKDAAAPAPVAPPARNEVLLEEIRDLLARKAV
jgi:large conductance mechanosensitive channel